MMRAFLFFFVLGTVAGETFTSKDDLVHALKVYLDVNQEEKDAIAAKYGPIMSWDVYQVEDMSSLFADAGVTEHFNEDISGWNTGGVKNMNNLFMECKAFNQPLASWDVSSVIHMANMFHGCEAFNQPLAGWVVSSVTSMYSMFKETKAFNQPLDRWDVSAVTTMEGMFREAASFNQSLSGWDVSSVTSLSAMFMDNVVFDQSLEGWDVSNVTNMEGVFDGATAFNQPLSGWKVSSATILDNMFSHASAFNQPLNDWDISSVNTMEYMFEDALAFNQDLCAWRRVIAWGLTPPVMENMFKGSACPSQETPSKDNLVFCSKQCEPATPWMMILAPAAFVGLLAFWLRSARFGRCSKTIRRYTGTKNEETLELKWNR